MTLSPDSRSGQISRGLARIRLWRRLFLALCFGFLPVTALTLAYIERQGGWLALAVPVALFALGLAVQRMLHRQRCPRCGGFFFVQTVSRTAYAPASSISFPPQKTCQNCGLRLYR